MNTHDLARLRARIITTLAELATTADTARAIIKESSEAIPNFMQDESDAARGEVDLENAMKLHSHSTARQALLQNALIRMVRGEYGLCKACSSEISLRRLEAFPGAILCIHCQEEIEFGLTLAPRPSKAANAMQVGSVA